MDPHPQVTRTVKVMVRHSTDCKDKNQGSGWRRCELPEGPSHIRRRW